MKKKLLVSFSGGESSAYMVAWLKKHKSGEYDMSFVYMNTSKEREETLIFADKVDKHFNINLVWIEAVFDDKKSIGYRITNFHDVKRKGEVFEEMIKCYGLPNNAYPHCSRELKLQPVIRYAKDVLKEYYTAIGIRADEIDRISKKWKEKRFYYPLIENTITKNHVNLFWNNMPFRLNLKGYEGNCNKCWKKSFRKLMTIAKDERDLGIKDGWWGDMEKKYSNYLPPHRYRKPLEDKKLTFFRKNLSDDDIVEMSKEYFLIADDDSINYAIQEKLFEHDLDIINGCSESCEVF